MPKLEGPGRYSILIHLNCSICKEVKSPAVNYRNGQIRNSIKEAERVAMDNGWVLHYHSGDIQCPSCADDTAREGYRISCDFCPRREDLSENCMKAGCLPKGWSLKKGVHCCEKEKCKKEFTDFDPEED